ncbi:hypothetical protein [Actinospica sp.]|uniref:hypothetical protein n=1 Tax=Actinospica sp. TaxID=1872142 RepID=UPI002C962DB4|nr:hypothetical protein [Actinospica sp.]HWG25037.1 hypothetical protein [Actinospica sp.]
MEADAREGRESQAPGAGFADPAGEGLPRPGAADDLADDIHRTEAIAACAQTRMQQDRTNMAARVRRCLYSNVIAALVERAASGAGPTPHALGRPGHAFDQKTHREGTGNAQ